MHQNKPTMLTDHPHAANACQRTTLAHPRSANAAARAPPCRTCAPPKCERAPRHLPQGTPPPPKHLRVRSPPATVSRGTGNRSSLQEPTSGAQFRLLPSPTCISETSPDHVGRRCNRNVCARGRQLRTKCRALSRARQDATRRAPTPFHWAEGGRWRQSLAATMPSERAQRGLPTKRRRPLQTLARHALNAVLS